jgi:hypothetical protein
VTHSHLTALRPAALAAALAAVVAGCAPKVPPATDALVFNQVHLDLPWKPDPQQIFASRPKPPASGFRLSDGGHVLEMLDGRLTLDGKGYGAVKAGDHVKVTQDGKVIVNGAERAPQGGPQGNKAD